MRNSYCRSTDFVDVLQKGRVEIKPQHVFEIIKGCKLNTIAENVKVIGVLVFLYPIIGKAVLRVILKFIIQRCRRNSSQANCLRFKII